MRHVRYRQLLAAACAAALAVSGAGAARAAQSTRVVLAETGYQSYYGLTDAGPADPGITVTDMLYLNVRDPAALAEHARAVSTPGSADYGRFSTPGQIQAQNELTPAQLGRVRHWLTSAGLTVSQPNWRQLSFTGTIGQLDNAFDVTFDNYTVPDPTDPFVYQIPTTDMSVPGDVGSLVLDVVTSSFSTSASTNGAHAANQASSHAVGAGVRLPARLGGGISLPHIASAPSSAPDSSTCSRYWGQKPATGMPPVDGQTPRLAPCGYTPTQLREAYGLQSATGKGQTVAVIMNSMDTLQQDVNTWSRRVGTPPLRPGQLTVVPTPDGSPPLTPAEDFDDMIENTLDVESVHGMAPDADIVSIGLSNSALGSITDSLTYVVDRTRASIVSLSFFFGETPGQHVADEHVYQEGALRGVGFYYASGDGPNFLPPQASDDWVTGVGGTSLAIGPNGAREWETGWGDTSSPLSPDGASWLAPQFGGGAGGGWAAGQPRPWYQQGVVSDREATGPDGEIDRTGPDVAMDADAGTGMLVGGTPLNGITSTADPSTWQYTELRFGGTSLSTPLFAGVQALAQQARGGSAFGFANPMLYHLAGTRAFRDVTKLTGPVPAAVALRPTTPGSFGLFLFQMYGQVPSTLGIPVITDVGPGFDTETGIGVPTRDYLSLSRTGGH